MRAASQWRLAIRRPSSWLAVLVAAHALRIIAGTLIDQFTVARFPHFGVDVDLVLSIDLPLLIGLGLLYLSISLWRRKRTAWVMAMATYVFLLGLMAHDYVSALASGFGLRRALVLLLPLLMVAALWVTRREFVVRSDARTFMSSVKVSAVVLLAAFLYGTAGFMLMERPDFHRDMSLASAMHYTIDQFALTTDPLHPYTNRARLFQDSLTFISVSAVSFVLISLFQPIKARYIGQKEHAERARQLVYEYRADSEDFFKLWPPDKAYFFGSHERSLIAYQVRRGTALAVGDPLASAPSAGRLLRQFDDLCFVNGWRPAFIHITPEWKSRFHAHGYQTQLIGKEAIVDVGHFAAHVAREKYFRQIDNRFSKLGYRTELLVPPHHGAVIDRLKVISDEWLKKPGRVERGFMMGIFSEAYVQQGPVFVARDAAGTIQAFLNVLPSPVPEEANFDMLRASDRAPGNCNDYLLVRYLSHLHTSGTKRLNMGLCPLAGIEDEPSTLINRTLRFVYSNGDRFYSFQGLYKFKAKYEPDWSERYIAYKGGPADFTRVMSALNAAMKVK